MNFIVISKGRKKNGRATAQVVIKRDGKSQTKHLVRIFDNVYMDKDAKTYDLK